MAEQVRKSYEEKRKRRRARGIQRSWKLKRIAADVEEEPVGKGRARQGPSDLSKDEIDRERFMEVSLPDKTSGNTVLLPFWLFTIPCGTYKEQ